VIVNVETDFPAERFQPGAELFVERGGRIDTLRVTSVRFHRERPVIGLAGVETMSQAEQLAGLELRIPAARLMPLPEGRYYHHDLVGCAVETRAGERVGTVRRVDASYGGDRLEVVDDGGAEILIPLVSPICVRIDVAAKRIVIEPPDGLLDLNR